MVTKVIMPKLSLTMKEGTVGKWYKKEGEPIEKNEPVVEVISEKATYDLEAPSSGVLHKILVEEGLNASVDTVLAIIASPNETVTEEDLPEAALQLPSEREQRVVASPAAKRLARERGIDLSLVKGSDPSARITEADVERFVNESSEVLPKVKETIPLAGYRRTSAERLSTSFRTAPHSTIVMNSDVSRAQALHDELGVSYTAILVKAAAKALLEHEIINSSFEENRIRVFENANVGVAVATENGLTVPVIHDADKKATIEIDALLAELSSKAKAGKLSKEQVTGGTFTITNLGMHDVDFFIPIINPPEAAILAVGALKQTPVVAGGKVEIRPVMSLSLTYDHRVVDGAPAAQFLRRIRELLENADKIDI